MARSMAPVNVGVHRRSVMTREVPGPAEVLGRRSNTVTILRGAPARAPTTSRWPAAVGDRRHRRRRRRRPSPRRPGPRVRRRRRSDKVAATSAEPTEWMSRAATVLWSWLAKHRTLVQSAASSRTRRSDRGRRSRRPQDPSWLPPAGPCR